jgi:hypothetical protein
VSSRILTLNLREYGTAGGPGGGSGGLRGLVPSPSPAEAPTPTSSAPPTPTRSYGYGSTPGSAIRQQLATPSGAAMSAGMSAGRAGVSGSGGMRRRVSPGSSGGKGLGSIGGRPSYLGPETIAEEDREED